jgi:hypothetical protein
MNSARALAPLLILAAAACQKPAEPGESRGSTTPRYERPQETPLDQAARPVRIGELGPNFAACQARGTTRSSQYGLEVRAAPFESAPVTGGVPTGGSFFVCTRSLDQHWLGIVYDEPGGTGERCGVSRPVAARRDYKGPCRSGWVASAGVKPAGR